MKQVSAVLVFDGSPVPKAIYKETFDASIIVATTGPRGASGDEGPVGPAYEPEVHDLATIFRNGLSR